MSTNFPIKSIQYVIGTISSWDRKMIELGGKTPSKHNSEYCDVILLLPLVGVNNYLTLLHMSKTFVYMNSIENYMNQFAIGFMVNPKLHVDKAFKYQVKSY